MSGSRELELNVRTRAGTRAVAAAVAERVRSGDLIGLVGELGAGKTQFVRGLAGGLGIDPDEVSSPTFVLMQEYEPAEPGKLNESVERATRPDMAPECERPVLVHIDAYRLHGPEELTGLGWGDDGEALREGAVVVVEWADHVSDAMGEHWLEVVLEHAGHGTGDGDVPHDEQGKEAEQDERMDESRRLVLRPHGEWEARMVALRRALAPAP